MDTTRRDLLIERATEELRKRWDAASPIQHDDEFMPEWRRRSLEGRNRFDAVNDTTDRVVGR